MKGRHIAVLVGVTLVVARSCWLLRFVFVTPGSVTGLFWAASLFFLVQPNVGGVFEAPRLEVCHSVSP